jgi:hypothetical protein
MDITLYMTIIEEEQEEKSSPKDSKEKAPQDKVD